MYNLICTAVVCDRDIFRGALLAPSNEMIAKGYLNQDWMFYSSNVLQRELWSGNVMFMTNSCEPFQLELTEDMIKHLNCRYHINSKRSASMFAHYTRSLIKFNYGDVLRARHNRYLHAASVTKIKRGLVGHQYLVHIWGNYTPDFQAFMTGFCPMLAAKVKCYECNHMIYTLSEDMLIKLCVQATGHKLLPYFNNCTVKALEDTVADNYAKDRYYLRAEMGEHLQELVDKYYIRPDELEEFAKSVMGKTIWTWNELTSHADSLEQYIKAGA